MVAHVEEAYALLDEFEIGEESNKINRGPPLCPSVCGCPPLHWNKRSCNGRLRTSLMAIVLLTAFGVIITLYGTRTNLPVGEQTDHLGYLLHPQAHASRPPTTLVFNWTITSGLRSPDGVEKQVYLVNDEFPGPLIEARSGDRLVVQVDNGLVDQDISLHWHGLSLKDQNAMDGAVGLTQVPVKPGSTFVYNFTIGNNESGTFWWHSHSDLQRADGLWGGLIVHSPEEDHALEEDYLIMVSDWFHRNQTEVLTWYADASSRGNEPVPDSLLINGQGRFNCSKAVPARPISCSQIELNGLKPLFKSVNKSIRLRVANTGSIAGFTIRLSGAKIQPAYVDGGFNVHSAAVRRSGILYPGQRVDFSVEWDSTISDNHQLIISMDDENFGYSNPSLDPTQTFPASYKDSGTSDTKEAQLDSDVTEIQVLEPQTLKSATKVTEIPPKAEQTLVFYAKTEKLAHLNYKPVGFINHTSWKPQTQPLISLNRSAWDENQLVPSIGITSKRPKRVDIVINNLDDGAHPFHMHGHSFYILSSYRNPGRDSWGSYNPFTGQPPPNGLNLDFPVRRDTVSVPRRGHVVLTLLAENPGIWAFHCHMLVHMARGMAMGLEVEYVDEVEDEHATA